MNTSGKRLRTLLDTREITYSDFATAMGVDPQHVNNWFHRGIPKARIFEIADFFKVDARWLAAGEEDSLPPATTPSQEEPENKPLDSGLCLEPLHPWDSHTPLDEDEAEVPLYKEVELAAGDGRTAVQEVTGRKLRFSLATLKAAGVTPSMAVCATVSGNSMEPLIMNGATIGLDRGFTHPVDGEIYALDHGGMLRVKLVYRLPLGGLRLRSFNREEYEDEDYTHEQLRQQEIRILGRVFWWSSIRPPRSPQLVQL